MSFCVVFMSNRFHKRVKPFDLYLKPTYLIVCIVFMSIGLHKRVNSLWSKPAIFCRVCILTSLVKLFLFSRSNNFEPAEPYSWIRHCFNAYQPVLFLDLWKVFKISCVIKILSWMDLSWVKAFCKGLISLWRIGLRLLTKIFEIALYMVSMRIIGRKLLGFLRASILGIRVMRVWFNEGGSFPWWKKALNHNIDFLSKYRPLIKFPP